MSIDKTLVGGNNKVYFFRTEDTGSAITLKSADGASTVTAYAGAAITLDVIEGAKPQVDSPLCNFELDQYQDDPAMLAFLKVAAWVPVTGADTSTIGEINLQDGTKMYGTDGGSAAPKYVLIYEGAKRRSANTRVFWAIYGTVEKTTGSTEEKSGSVTKPTFKFVGVKAPYDIAMGAAIRTGTTGSGLAATGQTLTIKAGLAFAKEFLNIA